MSFPMNQIIKLLLSTGILLTALNVQAQLNSNDSSKIWSTQKANEWYANHKWINGANFIPSTAINQLEMWQGETFDAITINRELGYAEGIGFNTMRVFLHSVAWETDKAGFKKRVADYLKIASKHHIETIFVFFDDCWNAPPKSGKQPEPKPGIHNSGWVQDPGIVLNNTDYTQIKAYVEDILTSFKHDKRILLWDLYNEPGNSGKGEKSLELLSFVFNLAHNINPDQPVSAGLWNWDFKKLNDFQIKNSDVITYHDYDIPDKHLQIIQELKKYGKPLICTEYMARLRNSTFENTMPMLKRENIGAINWGLVSGKTNTIYAWDTPIPSGEEPKLWFHDVFRKNGEPYKKEETELIKKLNTK